MDVTLPDGRVLKNVPDGTTQSQILAKLKANGEDISWAEQKKPTGSEVLAKETDPLEAFNVAAGHGVNRILNGITQAYLYARGEKGALEGLKSNVAEQDAAYSPLAKERPFTTGLGSAMPALAIPGAGGSYTGAAIAGALPELLSYGTPEERGSRGLLGAGGAMAGRAVGGLLSTALKPAGVGVKAGDEAMRAAKNIGYKPLAGEATQNRALLNIENYLSRSPGSSGALQRLTGQNQKAVDAAAMRSIGQVGDDASAKAFEAAKNAIGGEFNRLQSVTNPQLGSDFFNALVRVDGANMARGPFREKAVDSLVDKSLDLLAQGNLSGKAYKEIHTTLATEGTKAFKAGDAVTGSAYKTVREALDDAAKASLSTSDQKAWDTVRQQWGNWKDLVKGSVSEGGHVIPAKVAQQLRTKGDAFRTGKLKGELADIGHIGEAFKSATNPNSGNLTSTMLYGNPFTGIPLTAGNWLGEKVYTSPFIQKYLRDGILDIGKNGELIVKSTGVPLGIEATRKLFGTKE